MKPDDLPIYPTPQQSVYSYDASHPPPSSHRQQIPPNPVKQPHSSSQLPPVAIPANYAPQTMAYSAPSRYQQPPYQAQYQSPQYQPQQQPQQYHQPGHHSHSQQSYQSHPQQSPPQSFQAQPQPYYQSSGQHQSSRYQQQQQAPQQQPQQPPHQSPSRPQFYQSSQSKQSYAAPPSASYDNGAPSYAGSSQSGGRHFSSGSAAAPAQYTHGAEPHGPAAGASQTPLAPPSSGRPTKKPPPSAHASRENVADSSHSHVSSKKKLEMELRAVFDKVDTNHSGKISVRELSVALVNFDNTRFQDSTVRLMVNLFTSNHSSSLTFDQFISLWKHLTAYKKLFVAADVNKSGDISFGELQQIIEQIGYKLNVDLVLHLFQKFANKENTPYDTQIVGKLNFDAFIELLVYLRKLTDIFKKYDKDQSGVATVEYSDFLFEVSSLTM